MRFLKQSLLNTSMEIVSVSIVFLIVQQAVKKWMKITWKLIFLLSMQHDAPLPFNITPIHHIPVSCDISSHKLNINSTVCHHSCLWLFYNLIQRGLIHFCLLLFRSSHDEIWNMRRNREVNCRCYWILDEAAKLFSLHSRKFLTHFLKVIYLNKT